MLAVVGAGLVASCATRAKPELEPPVAAPQREQAPQSEAVPLSNPEGAFDVAPRLLHIPPPDHPAAAAARAKKIYGTVVVELTIDTSGRVTRARALNSVPELDAAAIEWVKRWRFKPAIRTRPRDVRPLQSRTSRDHCSSCGENDRSFAEDCSSWRGVVARGGGWNDDSGTGRLFRSPRNRREQVAGAAA